MLSSVFEKVLDGISSIMLIVLSCIADWKKMCMRGKSEFVGLVNLDFGKYKNVSHYGFNAVCKEKQYDWVCYMVTFWSVYNWIRNKRYVF